MATRLPTATRNAKVDAATALINAGGTGKVEIYTGTQPADPNAAITDTLLAELNHSATAYAAASAGTASANPISDDPSINNTGTAGWFRSVSGGGATVYQGACGLTSSGAELELNTTSFVAGGTCSITSMTYSQPQG